MNDIDPALIAAGAAILGSVVGGAMPVITGYISDKRRLTQERVQSSRAMIAEVRSLLSIIEKRQYLAAVKEMRSALQSNNVDSGSEFTLSVIVPDHYSRVYQSNLSKLGAVDQRILENLIEFHQILDGIVQDLHPGGSSTRPSQDLEFFTNLEQLLEHALALGFRILAVKI